MIIPKGVPLLPGLPCFDFPGLGSSFCRVSDVVAAANTLFQTSCEWHFKCLSHPNSRASQQHLNPRQLLLQLFTTHLHSPIVPQISNKDLFPN